MAIRFTRQSVTSDMASAALVPVAGHAAGSLVVLVLITNVNVAATLAVSDTKANAWNVIVNNQSAAPGEITIVIAWSLLTNALKSTDGDKINFGANFLAWGGEYSGVDPAPADKFASQLTAGFTTDWYPGAVTPAVNDELLIAAVGVTHASTTTPIGAWAKRYEVQSDNPNFGRLITVLERILVGGGTFGGPLSVGTWPVNDDGKAGIATFKPFVAAAAPANTLAPSISGAAPVNSQLVCDPGKWTNAPYYAYDWRRNGVSIGAPNSNVYTTVYADEGKTITCVVTATNAIGAASLATSNSIIPTATHTGPFAPRMQMWGQVISEWATTTFFYPLDPDLLVLGLPSVGAPALAAAATDALTSPAATSGPLTLTPANVDPLTLT